MGLTVRSDKKNAEIYLKQDGDDVDIHIVTPDGNDIVVAFFDSKGAFVLICLGEDDRLAIENFVETDGDCLSVN